MFVMEFIEIINQEHLAQSFKNIIVNASKNDDECENYNENESNVIIIRSNVQSTDDIKKWINEFSTNTDTRWILKKSWPNGDRMVCKRQYGCHHSKKNKAPLVERNLNSKGISKSTNCLASIILKVKVTTRFTKKSDEQVKNGSPCIITINPVHNHPIQSGDVLKYLPANESLKSTFFDYFVNGLAVSQSKKRHEKILAKNDEFTHIILANSSINPTYRTIQYWYEEWTKKNYGSRDNSDLIRILREKQGEYLKKGTIISYTIDPFTVCIVTHIMQRTHEMSSSKDIAFIDTTSCCNGNNHAITFILTACAAGAVPVGVLITGNQQIETFASGFSQLKNSIKNSFGKQGYPNVIITDKCASEINAIKVVWPQSSHFLCIFHVLQYVGRWLRDSNHDIPACRQREFYNSFQRILYCTNVTDAENAYEAAVAIASGFDSWIKYLTDQWEIKERILAYRVGFVEHHTNNYPEVTVRIFKDNVLERIKAYNAIALIDFIASTMETVYCEKLRDFSFNRKTGMTARLHFEHVLKKCSYLTAEDVVKINDYEYTVRGETAINHFYAVNENGFCTCEQGLRGKFCKHLCGVYKFFGTIFSKMPPITMKDRQLMAYVAFGSGQPNLNFFLPSPSHEYQHE